MSRNILSLNSILVSRQEKIQFTKFNPITLLNGKDVAIPINSVPIRWQHTCTVNFEKIYDGARTLHKYKRCNDFRIYCSIQKEKDSILRGFSYKPEIFQRLKCFFHFLFQSPKYFFYFIIYVSNDIVFRLRLIQYSSSVMATKRAVSIDDQILSWLCTLQEHQRIRTFAIFKSFWHWK